MSLELPARRLRGLVLPLTACAVVAACAGKRASSALAPTIVATQTVVSATTVPVATPSPTAVATPDDRPPPVNLNGLNKQRVTFVSDGLTLVGYIYKPDGPGPFPAIIWNHGSEADPGGGPEFDSVAAHFVPAGYVVMAPERRGHSESAGTYIQNSLMSALQTKGKVAAENLFTQLMQTEQLDDQLAGLSYLKSQPFVDTSKLAVVGCSYGGVQTLLGATANAGYKVAVAVSPGAESWDGNPIIQQWLVGLANKIDIPVLIIHPPMDASLEPGRQIGAALQALGKPYELKIFPPSGNPKLDTHCFGGPAGQSIWSPYAIAYLNSALGR